MNAAGRAPHAAAGGGPGPCPAGRGAPVLPRWRQAAYGVLGLPLAMAALPLYVTLPAWYATHYGVPLAQLGWILLAVRLVDTVQDPVLGHALDRASAPGVRRAMLGAAVLLALAFAGLWHPPGSGSAAAWLAGMLVAAGAAHSVLNLAYLAWGARLPAPAHARARGLLGPAGWREAAGLAGVLLASAIPPALQALPAARASSGIAIYCAAFAMGLLAALAALLRWAPPWPAAGGAAPTAVPPDGTAGPTDRLGGGVAASGAGSWRSAVRRLLAQPAVRRLLLPYSLNALSVALPSTLALFFIDDQLQAAPRAGAFLFCYFAAAAAGVPAWVALAVKLGVLPAWRLGMALAIASFAGAVALGPGDAAWFYLICSGAGAALGADLALPPVLLAERLAPGVPAGLPYGALALLGKLALALGGLALPLLAMAGYQPGHGPHAALPLAYALLPCLCKLAALLTLGPGDGHPSAPVRSPS